MKENNKMMWNSESNVIQIVSDLKNWALKMKDERSNKDKIINQ